MKPHCLQPRKTDVALATVFAIYGLACGLIGFGFYTFMQPRYMANPGVVAYRPFPGTLINHPPTNELTYYEPQLTALVDQSQTLWTRVPANEIRLSSPRQLQCLFSLQKTGRDQICFEKTQRVGSTGGELSKEVYCASPVAPRLANATNDELPWPISSSVTACALSLAPRLTR